MSSARIKGVLSALLVLLFMGGLFFGPADLGWFEQWNALLGREQGMAHTIIWSLRLPRLCTALLAGAGLGLSGLMMQTYFRNALAGPSVLGVTSGATLGVAMVALGTGAVAGSADGWGVAPQVVGALVGGGLVMVLLGLVMGRFRSRTALLIFGLMVGYLTGAMVTVLQAGADAGALQAFVHWGMGSFAHGNGLSCAVLAVATALAAWWSLRDGSSFDMWSLGTLAARTMGVDERKFTWAVLGTASALAGLVTAWCGPVAFLGLATPHLVRAMGIRGRMAVMLVPVLLTGGVLALLADGVVRWMGIPLNAVLSLVGAPVVLLFILGKGPFARQTQSALRS